VLQRFTTVTAMLGISPDPFATPPVHTLDSLVDTELSGVPRCVTIAVQQPPGVLGG
jgi:hypothetical protein